MNPFLEQILQAGMAERTGIAQADHQLAMRRASDTALHGLKVVEGVVAKELLISDDASEMSRLNSAVRVPTTIEHMAYPAKP